MTKNNNKIKLIEPSDFEHNDFRVLLVSDLQTQEINTYYHIAECVDVCMLDADVLKLENVIVQWQPGVLIIDVEYVGQSMLETMLDLVREEPIKVILHTLNIESLLVTQTPLNVEFVSKNSPSVYLHHNIKHYAILERASQAQQSHAIRVSDELDKVHHRIARDIHDEFGGLLSSMMLKLYAMQNAVKQDHWSKQATLKCCENLENLVIEASASVKKICANNREPHFENGLLPQLNKFIKTLEVNITKQVTSDAIKLMFKMDNRVLFQVYRIIQESLNNVQFHSKAADAIVKINAQKASLLVEVVDQGVGFVVDANANKQNSFGLVGMKERAKSIDATITIDSTINQGTHVRLEVPTKLLP